MVPQRVARSDETTPLPSTPEPQGGEAPARFVLWPLPDFALFPFAGFLDKLRFSADEHDLSRQRRVQWTVVGQAEWVRASCGVTVQVDSPLTGLDWLAWDHLVIFGARTTVASQALAARCAPALREAARLGLNLVAIDNASFVLAEAGLLQGREVAVHWRHAQEFRDAYPQIPVRPEQIYWVDGPRVTCAGGATAVDVAADLLSRHLGPARALKGLADMLVDEARGGAHRLRSLQAEPHAGRHLERAMAVLRTSLEQPPSMQALADQLGLGRRHLDRLFAERLGTTAHGYLQRLRLAHAQWRLLNTSRSLAQIALEVGCSSPAQLSRLFQSELGLSATAWRRQWRQKVQQELGA